MTWSLGEMKGEALHAFRREAQLVFQNPFDALNPRFTIYRAVAGPLLNADIDMAEHADPVATAEIVRTPRHPYTRALVAAVPVPDADQSHAPLPITGNIPDAREPPSGCRFRDRCPHAVDRCAVETPALLRTIDGHRVACHLS